MRQWPLVIFLALLSAFSQRPACASPAAFADWAAVVVAGDDHAHSGDLTETFDNARRDVAAELVRKGFSPGNVLQFSVRPELYPAAKPLKADLAPIYDGLRSLAQRAKGGCLVYFTSHGAPQGVVLDNSLLPPRLMDDMVSTSCGNRPTVVIISACFSGVFIPALAANNRMIITAARPDRTSFGCGANDRYPYFDACLLQSLPDAHDFSALAPKVQQCVASRETELGASPPSEPQVWIGPALRPVLPLMGFAPASGGASCSSPCQNRVGG
ncbi:MAG: peptidase C13 [Caulobacteraceae bacterium]|nr:peptidase C13 [Caulobacteraceae bacterium]